MVGRNINVPSQIEYKNFWIEYGEFINASEISNGDDAIDDVWNVYNHENVPDQMR